jgi:hypothetical protein
MAFFFPDDLTPRALPADTRLLSLRADPYPDRARIRVEMDVTPFETRPHIEVTLFDADGHEVTAVSFIEPMTWNIEFTLHLRGRTDPAGGYRLEARLYYPDGPAPEPLSIEFEIPAAG